MKLISHQPIHKTNRELFEPAKYSRILISEIELHGDENYLESHENK